jgi:hypothetical protein
LSLAETNIELLRNALQDEKLKNDQTVLAKEVHEKISRLEIENGQLRRKVEM